MAVLLTHDIFMRSGFGRNHPLAFARHAGLMQLCGAMGWLEAGQTRRCPLATIDELARFHDRDYLAAFEQATRSGLVAAEVRERYNIGTMECPLFDGLWERARASVGGAVMAAQLALDGEVAFHPAGGTHHGRPGRASGFCYFNDPVFAILTLLDTGLERVAYVDLDAHHGDGVQDGLAHDERVMTVSIHEAGRWPGTGIRGDRGGGRAVNLPVPAAFNDSELDLLMREAVLPRLRGFGPQAVVITCGTDAVMGDPLSRLALSNGALWDAVEAVRGVAPVGVVLGGGGYNPWTLTRCWAGLWARLSGRTIPGQVTDAAAAVLAGFDCDLVEEEDRRAFWFDSIIDPPNTGAIRPEVRELAAEIRQAP